MATGLKRGRDEAQPDANSPFQKVRKLFGTFYSRVTGQYDDKKAQAGSSSKRDRAGSSSSSTSQAQHGQVGHSNAFQRSGADVYNRMRKPTFNEYASGEAA